MTPLTIVCISDTHELHRELDVPNGDILIHAGDFTMFSKSAAAILDFNAWLAAASAELRSMSTESRSSVTAELA
jgi:hypothetical protein